MNLQEIAIFKRFIAQHELRKNFINKYKKSIGMTRNPESIEQYFSNVEAEKVITSAVKCFVTNEAMGFDFWQSVDISWQAYLQKLLASHTIEHEDASTLRGYYSALRENWDKEKPWVYEPISVAKIRYGLITPEEAGLVDEDKGNKTEPQEADNKQLIDFSDGNDDDLDIDFVPLNKASRVFNGLHSGIMSVNIRSGSWKVMVNRFDTSDIKRKQVKFAMVGSLKSGDVVIQFNNNINGVPILYTSESYYHVNSRQLVEHLRRMLGITDDLVYLRIEKIAEKIDSITYKVNKQ